MAGRHLGPIEVERIFLYEENPRHEPIESEPEIIAHLCKDEQVYNLARSISQAGPNPLDLSGLVETSDKRTLAPKKTYQVWEGNRRICAIKLLNDPDLAPAHLRKDFVRLASESAHIPLKKVTAVVFDDHDDLKFWMGINHNGEQGGIGRRTWDTQQKERHFGSGRNRVALAVLDAAETLGLIAKEERDRKITTAQRFLNSDIVREAIGLDTSNKEDVAYTRPLNDLKKQLGRFIGDLKRGIKVHSRANRAQADTYGRKLARNAGISGERTQPISLQSITTTSDDAAKKKKKAAGRKKPRKHDTLEYDKALELAIESIGNEKLESLYFSLYSIRLEAHTPLLTIGVWAFVETLSALAGRNSGVDFIAYFSNERLAGYGFTDKKKSAPLRQALERIQENGNATKHHEISASFHGKQLANDFATITPLMLKLLAAIASKK